MKDNVCICCGEYVPEGEMICAECKNKYKLKEKDCCGQSLFTLSESGARTSLDKGERTAAKFL